MNVTPNLQLQSIAPGTRVRCQRLFHHWRQTPGTVVDVDRYFGVAEVEFDNGVKRWTPIAILEIGS